MLKSINQLMCKTVYCKKKEYLHVSWNYFLFEPRVVKCINTNILNII